MNDAREQAPSTTGLPERARELAAKARELHQELDAANNPDRQALRSLGVTNLGWTPLAYSDEAFRIWSRKHERDPNDIETLHHMAIMHHARAIDLEQSDHPTSADDDWRTALQLWHTLWTADTFWERIAAAAAKGGKRDAIDQVRRQFPGHYLKIHYDIATQDDIKVSRRNFHIDLALQSPFPEEAKTQVRTQTYERYAAEIPDSVWQSASPDAEEAERAGEVILRFLEMDPECEIALSDALRIVVRVIRTRATDLQAMGDEDEAARNRILHSIQQMSDKWRPYFELLAKSDVDLADDVIRDYCLWARVSGEVLDAIGDKQAAMAYYQMGTQTGDRDEYERLKCARRLALIQADHARNMANADDADTRSYCDALAHREDLTIIAHMLLANAYQLINENDSALAICARGLSLEPEVAHLDFMEEDEAAIIMVKDLQSSIVAQRGFNLANTAYGENRYADAIPEIDAAIEAQSDQSAFFLLRARCHLRLLDADSAHADLERYRELEDEVEDDEFIANTASEIDELRNDLITFGKTALELKRQAATQYTDNDLVNAEQNMRLALDQSNAAGTAQISHELAIILTNRGIVEANANPGNMQVIQRSQALLREAIELDPDNQHARDNLAAITENVEIQASSLERYGAETHRLIEVSKQAQGEGDYAGAVHHLRDALSMVTPTLTSELEEKLSATLSAWGVDAANSADGDVSRLVQAQTYLEEAVQLDANNDHATTNLSLIKEAVVNQYRSNAAEHFNNNQSLLAIHPLERAYEHAEGTLLDTVREELATVLAAHAVNSANAAQELYNGTVNLGLGSSLGSLNIHNDTWPAHQAGIDQLLRSESPINRLRNSLNDSQELLTRACNLDPGNTGHLNNLNAVTQLLNQL